MAGQARKKTRIFCRIGLFPRPVQTQLGPCRADSRETGSEFVLHLELSALVVLVKGPVLKGSHHVAFSCPS